MHKKHIILEARGRGWHKKGPGAVSAAGAGRRSFMPRLLYGEVSRCATEMIAPERFCHNILGLLGCSRQDVVARSQGVGLKGYCPDTPTTRPMNSSNRYGSRDRKLRKRNARNRGP
jgi:hypothetical protein